MGSHHILQHGESDPQSVEKPQPFRPAPRRVADESADTLPPEFAAPAEDLPPPTLPQLSATERVSVAVPRRKSRRIGCGVWAFLTAALGVGCAYYYYQQKPAVRPEPVLLSTACSASQELPVAQPQVSEAALADAEFARGDFAAALPRYQSSEDKLTAEQHYRYAVCLHRSAENAPFAEALVQMENVLHHYAIAAEQGHADAASALGTCYYKGLGTAPSLNDAVKWYTVAAEQNVAEAQFRLAWCLMESAEPQDAVAFQWLSQAAAQGHVAACYDLAVCYLTGRGTQENAQSAVQYLRLAVEKKHPAAMRRLAFCYRDGKGVTQDTTRALELFAAASAAGDAEAQYNYAWALQRGYGTVADSVSALRLYLLAASKHFAPAQDALQSFLCIRLLPEMLVDCIQKSQNYPKM